jgi:2-polyprenyl-6-methoxyphenol hydroxylase-like FAD-dependent oxidoreductase
MNHVAIAGAGPAGAATALLLAQQGLKVTLLEKETHFDRLFRGEGLMPAGLDALYQMGLKETFASIVARQLTSWDFYVGGKRRMRVVEPEKAGLATQIIDQGALLKAIVHKAQQLPNFAFYPGWQVSALLRDESGSVTGVQATGEGESQHFEADCVIACDGRYSRLRKLAGLAIVNSPAQFDVLWFKLPAPRSLATETPFVACLQSDRQFAFYPSWDGRLQMGWIVEKSAHKAGALAKLKERDWIEEFACALPTELADHFRVHKDELEGPIYLDVQVGCCSQWSIPGLLLIGDAAHPMAPNRAQGINMALRDAIVVANHFAAMAKPSKGIANSPGPIPQQIPQRVLQQIQSERQPEIEAVQKKQLAEWRKVEFISRPGLPYWGFKAISSIFGPFQFAQNIWLHEQKELREGVLPVRLQYPTQ